MSRQTSIDAYNHIKNNGLLSQKRLQVYESLYEHGPMTATEIASRIPNDKSPSVGFNVHARLCELREMGIISELGTQTCPITGMNVILWDVNANLPKKIEKKISVKMRLALAELVLSENNLTDVYHQLLSEK